MEYILFNPTPLFISLFIVSFFLVISRYGNKRKTLVTKTAPKAGGAWPIIGHLHLLRGPELPHKVLGAMADKVGPIFSIKLGLNQAIVVSDWEMAKECLNTNDAVFANRPKSIAFEVMTYNHRMIGFAPYGPYWRQLRKIFNVELLSSRRLELLANIRLQEVNNFTKHIYELWKKNKTETGSNKVSVDMKKWFGDLAMSMIMRMVTGKRYSDEEVDKEEIGQFQAEITKFFELIAMYLVGDAFPFLRWLDLGGHEKAMKNTWKKFDVILQKWLDEHKLKRISGKGKDEQDFMDVMLSILEDDDVVTEDLSRYDADIINKSTCLSAFVAATDTTTVTLTWVLSLLLNNRHTLNKAQEELETHVGKKRRIEESDLKNLVYLQAIIKESMRLYPVLLLVPRESRDDCTVGGYHIPKGTRLLVNASKIQRDPRTWTDPNEFRPERFLTTHKDVDVKGLDFEIIPFGSGRRICPGISFSLQVMQLTLASLLHSFQLSTSSDEPVDMSEGMGLANMKATPLEVYFTPCLSPSLFQ